MAMAVIKREYLKDDKNDGDEEKERDAENNKS